MCYFKLAEVVMVKCILFDTQAMLTPWFAMSLIRAFWTMNERHFHSCS